MKKRRRYSGGVFSTNQLIYSKGRPPIMMVHPGLHFKLSLPSSAAKTSAVESASTATCNDLVKPHGRGSESRRDPHREERDAGCR